MVHSETERYPDHQMSAALWIKSVKISLNTPSKVPVYPSVGLIFHIKQVCQFQLKGDLLHEMWIKCIGYPEIVYKIGIQDAHT